MILRTLVYLVFCLLLASCISPKANPKIVSLANVAYLPTPDSTLSIPNLRRCTNTDNNKISINSNEPIIVIVHGCFSSAGRFTALADVFAFHGQQAICFVYDDRDSLEQSSAQLIESLEQLSNVMKNPNIAVIGHSQGGLIARRSLIQDRSDAFSGSNTHLSLTTISGPFGGIEAAAHCGSTLLAWLSLGLTKPICHIVTGAKYREIPPNSAFINEPGTLLPLVDRHIKIDTDEKNTCRRYDLDGRCLEDDFVFSLNEQNNLAIDAGSRLSPITVKAGHIEIVGDQLVIPHKLIAILQENNILKPTLDENKNALDSLLRELYVKAN